MQLLPLSKGLWYFLWYLRTRAFTLLVDDDTVSVHELLLQRILVGNKPGPTAGVLSPSSDANEIPYKCQEFQGASSGLIKSEFAVETSFLQRSGRNFVIIN